MLIKGFRFFAFRVSGLILIFFMRLDGSKNIQFVNSSCLVLHLEFKGNVLLPLERNDKGEKMNKEVEFQYLNGFQNHD